MYFPSKKDIWLSLLYWGVILFIVLIYIFGGEPVGMQLITYKSVLGYVLSASTIGLLLWIWFRTGYKLVDGIIKVQYGPFRRTITIKEIKKLNKNMSPFMAPALSVDRLEILHNNYKIIHVSPKNEEEFIRLLVKENPKIQISHKIYSENLQQ
ncbi:PH domain-containing protein [Halobacillus locisalis]|uniref:PH domain-containing protein n=1 Tax=Halobacillus locisalis TaxID=220753 RepID=A0A838CSK1_9BACI|nr:PH domain-containing protein [Halobacillus locisalis]